MEPAKTATDVMADGEITGEDLEETYEHFELLVQSDFLMALVAAGIILAVTAVLVHLVTSFIRRVMNHEASLIPANSIILNVVRVLLWALGLSFMLSFCFNVNVNALITALGVGGIAVSLGMQDTISNVIGGMNVSVSGLVKPGDHIKLGTTGLTGVVKDVTLRQTIIEDSVKNQIIVPNATMNTSMITKIQPRTHVVIPVVIRAEDDRLTAVAHNMEHAVEHAVARVSKLKKAPSITFTEITEYGYRGSMVFDIVENERVNASIDAAVRAMALYAHGNVAQMAANAKAEAGSAKLEPEGTSPEAAKAAVSVEA